MSIRDRNSIAAQSATLHKDIDAWTCISDQYSFKGIFGTVDLAATYLADVDPALAAPVQVAVPSEILLTDTIDPAGDFDVYALNVVAGETYMISVRGTGADPLADSVVFLLDDTFTVVYVCP